MQIPIDKLKRIVKLRSSYSLGVVCLPSRFSLAPEITQRTSLKTFCDSLDQEFEKFFQLPVHRIFALDEIAPELMERLVARDRTAKYKLLGLAASWRQGRVTIVDLSSLSDEVISTLGCQCDGLVGVLHTPTKEALDLVQSMQSCGGNWLGYWEMPFDSRLLTSDANLQQLQR